MLRTGQNILRRPVSEKPCPDWWTGNSFWIFLGLLVTGSDSSTAATSPSWLAYTIRTSPSTPLARLIATTINHFNVICVLFSSRSVRRLQDDVQRLIWSNKQTNTNALEKKKKGKKDSTYLIIVLSDRSETVHYAYIYANQQITINYTWHT